MTMIFVRSFHLLLLLCSSISATEETTTFHNGLVVPLRGLGVGNLPHEFIPTIVSQGITEGIRLIDTAHASANERLIGMSIPDDVSLHIVTKVWYTHLGYERTKHSVLESIQELGNHNSSHIHMLLHWPRCRDDIEWMNCQFEEDNLSATVRALGPAPNDGAFLESWKALEESYETHHLASIGISNFDVSDLTRLLEMATIVPHMIQLNVYSLLFDPDLVLLCRTHQIHIQVYNVMNGIMGNMERSPNAMHMLNELADDATTPAMLILAWLTQYHNVSVIPRTTRHVTENVRIVSPPLSLETYETIDTAVRVILQGKDLELPRATFVSHHDTPVHVYWKHEGQEYAVKEHLQPGESFQSNTYKGHVFVVYETNEEKPRRREFEITAGYGDEQNIHIEL